MSGPRWICKPERAATSCRHSTDANLGGYKNPGHLIRTQGGRGHAHGMGSPSGGVDSQSAPKRYHAGVRGRGLWLVHSQQQYQSWARGAGMVVHAAAASVHVSLIGSS